MLEKLINTAKNEKYYDSSKEEIEKLKKEFTHSIDRDMSLFKEEISQFLAEQFIQRYYFLEGVIEYKVKHDEEINKAVSILSDKSAYDNMLK